jgi:pimeloyl-ACP methyl ester carboxylesterase
MLTIDPLSRLTIGDYMLKKFLILCWLSGVLAVGTAAQTRGKNPVIIIPGVTGSKLVNPYTGKTVWFNIDRDKDDDLRLPISSPILSRNRDSLVVEDVIREIKIKVLPDVEVYQVLLDALKEKGYKEADWKKPEATDVFYVFAYDWRRDNVETAHMLLRRMAAVKRTLKRPGLKFDIVAHSMGGLVARYAAMYGLADLPHAGSAPVPNWRGSAHINKLMMFGTPNEGSVSALDALLNGYPVLAGRKLPFVDDMRAEDVFTTPSAFQLIPHQASARFLDENLKPLEIDIYDPDTWFKYGWGPLTDPKFLSKLKDAAKLAETNKEIKPEKPDKKLVGDDLLISRTTFAQARAYFVSALGRAKLFHMAIEAPSKASPIQLFAYGGNCEPTLDAVVLIRDEKKGRWETWFNSSDIKTSNGLEIKKDQVKAAMYAIGDGRVTTRSLLAETVFPKNGEPDIKPMLTLKKAFFACGSHTQLFLEKPIQDSFLSALVVETQDQP